MSFIYIYLKLLSILFPTAVALLIMKLLEKNFKKYLIFVPIVCILFFVPHVIGYGSYILEHINEAISQYNIVSQWAPAYAKQMSYLYTDQLLEALKYIVFLAIGLIPTTISFIYYYKLNKDDERYKEMKKMKIKDL